LIRTDVGIYCSAFRNGNVNAHAGSVAEAANGSRRRCGFWFKYSSALVA
jgi:hypothetical protein